MFLQPAAGKPVHEESSKKEHDVDGADVQSRSSSTISGGLSVEPSNSKVHRRRRKGRYLYDVRKIFGFFAPFASLPLSRTESRNLILSAFWGPPSPHLLRTSYKYAPKEEWMTDGDKSAATTTIEWGGRPRRQRRRKHHSDL